MTQPQSKLNLLEFKVVKEPWNVYKLKDGSTLRVKVVLKYLIKEGVKEFSIGTSNVIAVVPNPSFIGLPSPPLKEGEDIESYIGEEDLKILSQSELWNEYKVASENMTFKFRAVVVTASRTKRHDEKGVPIYVANIQLLVKPEKGKK